MVNRAVKPSDRRIPYAVNLLSGDIPHSNERFSVVRVAGGRLGAEVADITTAKCRTLIKGEVRKRTARGLGPAAFGLLSSCIAAPGTALRWAPRAPPLWVGRLLAPAPRAQAGEPAGRTGRALAPRGAA